MLAVFAGRRRFVRCSDTVVVVVLPSVARTQGQVVAKLPSRCATLRSVVWSSPHQTPSSKEQGRFVAKSLVRSPE
eukprot:6401128-Amphidinium_carterae.1